MRLFLLFFLVVLFGLLAKVFNKLVTEPMINYPYFTNLWLTVLTLLVMLLCYLVPRQLLKKKGGSQPTPPPARVPQKWLLLFGLLDSVSGLLLSFGATYVPGDLMVLLMQCTVPISMASSIIITGAKYSPLKYLGAVIVLAGIAVVVVPDLKHPASSSSTSPSSGSLALWSSVLVGGCIPMAVSSVYKERMMVKVPVDVVEFNFLTTLYQLLITLALLVPSVYATPGQGIGSVGRDFRGGFLCFLGRNTQPGDNCSKAPMYLSLNLAVNFVFSILCLLVIKFGSASLMYLALTIVVPLARITFSLHFMPESHKMTVADIVGLVVVVAGLSTFRFATKLESLFKTGTPEKEPLLHQVN
jgi:drug/metabolite transporter (DMT)-like permease